MCVCVCVDKLSNFWNTLRYVPQEDLEKGIILPRVTNIRDCSAKVAAAVGLAAMETGAAHGGIRGIKWSSPTLAEDLKEFMWTPQYEQYIDATWKRDLHKRS